MLLNPQEWGLLPLILRCWDIICYPLWANKISSGIKQLLYQLGWTGLMCLDVMERVPSLYQMKSRFTICSVISVPVLKPWMSFCSWLKHQCYRISGVKFTIWSLWSLSKDLMPSFNNSSTSTPLDKAYPGTLAQDHSYYSHLLRNSLKSMSMFWDSFWSHHSCTYHQHCFQVGTLSSRPGTWYHFFGLHKIYDS